MKIYILYIEKYICIHELMKTLLVGIAKLENKYIREWVEYHLNLGFDYIILGDNNNPDGEYLSEPIGDYIQQGRVGLINCRDNSIMQMEFYQFVYDNYCKDYDWSMFLDIDEFLFFKEDKTVTEYLSRPVFDNFNSIKINWLMMSDNNHLINTGEPVLKRFTQPAHDIPMTWSNQPGRKLVMNSFVKSFVRPGIPNTQWDNAPQLIPKTFDNIQLKICNNCGIELDKKYIDDTCLDIPDIDYTLAYIKHFRTKTIEEYISNKCQKGWPIVNCNTKEWVQSYLNLGFFFDINEPTPEKKELARQLMEKYDIEL